jgi:hypothetical protein
VKIFKDLSIEIPDTNSYHWNFEPFQQEDGNILAVGFNSLNQSGFEACRSSEGARVALFNNWAPCEYAQRNVKKGIDAVEAEEKFDYVLTICPYSAEWRNQNSSKKRYIYSFYPYSPEIIPPKTEKKYDAIYHGGIHGKEHLMAMRVLMKINYRYLSLDYGINPLTQRYLKYATDINLPFKEKIKKIAECKISVCFNLIHVSYKHYKNICEYRSQLRLGGTFFDELKPFHFLTNYPWIGVLPQFKTRIHEAAISRTVNLVYRDKWNIVEDYYEPDREFIYFDDEADLQKKVEFILTKWDSDYIQQMVEAAYTKAMRYTSANFMEKYSRILRAAEPASEPSFNQTSFWS